MGVLADADLRAVEVDEEDALGRADVEHDPPAGPARRDLELALVDARRVRARGRSAAGPRTASGRWCSAAGPRSRPSSRGPGRRPRPSRRPGSRPGLRAAGSASGRRAARRSPWGTLCMGSRPTPSARGGPRSGHSTIVARAPGAHSAWRDAPRRTVRLQRCSRRPRHAPRHRPGPSVRRAVGGPRAWTSRSAAARSSACSDPTARARPRPSGC